MSELSSPLKLRAAGALSALRRSNPVALSVTISLCTSIAIAGTDTTFDSITSILLDAFEGLPGKVLTLAGFATALRGGLIQGSAAKTALGIAIAIAIALGAVYGPGILTTLYSGTF